MRIHKRSESFSTSESGSAKTSASSASQRTSDSESSSSEDQPESQNRQSGGRVKNFLKNLLNLSKKNSKSNPNLAKPPSQKEKQNENIELTNRKDSISSDIVQELPIHPFLSIKNKEPNFYNDFQIAFQIDIERFKLMHSQSIQSGDFKKITDFFCWIFSKSSNLIDLLVTEKYSKRKESLTRIGSASKKYDASFYVSANWKFMKEIYTSLQKMVKYFQSFTL